VLQIPPSLPFRLQIRIVRMCPFPRAISVLRRSRARGAMELPQNATRTGMRRRSDRVCPAAFGARGGRAQA